LRQKKKKNGRRNKVEINRGKLLWHGSKNNHLYVFLSNSKVVFVSLGEKGEIVVLDVPNSVKNFWLKKF